MVMGERAQKTDRTGVKNCGVEANQTRETRMRGQRGTAVSGDEGVKGKWLRGGSGDRKREMATRGSGNRKVAAWDSENENNCCA